MGPVITRSGEAPAAARFVTGLPVEGKNDGSKNADSVNSCARQGLVFNALAADKGGRHMEPFIVDIEPSAEQEKSAHEGEEFIHILSGKLSLEYGTASHVLNAGDSVYYDSIVPHRVLSANKEPVRILAVIYTPL